MIVWLIGETVFPRRRKQKSRRKDIEKRLILMR